MEDALVIKVLRQRFEQVGCKGIVALIDYIESERRAGRIILKIGSNSVDWDGELRKAKARNASPEQIRALYPRLHRRHFGQSNGSRKPIDDLFELSTVFEQKDRKSRQNMDILCQDLVREDNNFTIIVNKIKTVKIDSVPAS